MALFYAGQVGFYDHLFSPILYLCAFALILPSHNRQLPRSIVKLKQSDTTLCECFAFIKRARKLREQTLSQVVTASGISRMFCDLLGRRSSYRFSNHAFGKSRSLYCYCDCYNRQLAFNCNLKQRGKDMS